LLPDQSDECIRNIAAGLWRHAPRLGGGQETGRDRGGDGGGAIQVPEVTTRDNLVMCSFSQPDIACPPFLSALLGYQGPVSRHYISYFHAPCMHVIWDSISKLDRETGQTEPLGALLHIHAVTPATRTTAHYFQGEGQNFSHGEPCLAEAFRTSELVSKALDEDVSATLLIEKSIAAGGGRIPEILLKADKAAVLGRRLLQAMIHAETAG
jgi:vanillate O-demethylase monooxygenase subunit